MSEDNILEGVNVSISGIHDEDELAKSNVQEEVSKALGKLVKVTGVSSFSMHVRKYHKEGSKAKYSVHGKALTAEGEFFAEDFAWGIEEAVKGVLDKLEKEMVRHVEKGKVHGRAP
jgi:ribosome-associated translation inhibitor RaiA